MFQLAKSHHQKVYNLGSDMPTTFVDKLPRIVFAKLMLCAVQRLSTQQHDQQPDWENMNLYTNEKRLALKLFNLYVECYGHDEAWVQLKQDVLGLCSHDNKTPIHHLPPYPEYLTMGWTNPVMVCLLVLSHNPITIERRQATMTKRRKVLQNKLKVTIENDCIDLSNWIADTDQLALLAAKFYGLILPESLPVESQRAESLDKVSSQRAESPVIHFNMVAYNSRDWEEIGKRLRKMILLLIDIQQEGQSIGDLLNSDEST